MSGTASANRPRLEPDREQLESFINALFRYADEDGFVSVRAFLHERNKPPPYIHGVRINGAGLAPIVGAAVAGARNSAAGGWVFAPPVATFADGERATEDVLENGLALTVDLDSGNPAEALRRLEGLLGRATVVVASGGEIADPDTGELYPKLHAHWRLSEPTRTPEEHATLKYARRLACGVVGADPTMAPPVHPVRWPGSWHLKNPSKPRLARIVALNDAAEVHLAEVLELLEIAMEAAGITQAADSAGPRPTSFGTRPSHELQAPVEIVRSALQSLPNDDEHWEVWNTRGLLTYAATGGSPEGLEAWEAWSAKSARKHEAGACEARWQRFHRSPPTRGGAGSIFYLAKQHGWTDPRHAQKREEPPPHDEVPPWENADAEPEREQPKARNDNGKSEPEEDPLQDFINPAIWQFLPVPEREWLVRDWIPIGVTTGLYGDGGVGKTLLAQQLMTSCATGTPWCGVEVMRCRSLAWLCEDDEDELHRRQAKIVESFGLKYADLSDIRIMSRVGYDNTLVSFTPDGRMQITELFDKIAKAATAFEARLIVLDNASDMFAGNENDRHQVKQFVGVLTRLGREIGGAVVLNAHPSREGLRTGNLDGGSTQWNNSFRSRLTFGRVKAESGEQPDSDERILARRKANYASIDVEIKMRWVNGVFVPILPEDGIDSAIKRAECEAVFLNLLDTFEAQKQRVSASKNAGNFAPKVFGMHPDRQGFRAKDFERAMTTLLRTRQIKLIDYGRPGDVRQRLVRAPADTADDQ